MGRLPTSFRPNDSTATLGYQGIGVILLAVLMPRLHATADEVLAVITLCVAVIAAQPIIHLIAAYVRMPLLLNRVASGSSGQAEIRTSELSAELTGKAR